MIEVIVIAGLATFLLMASIGFYERGEEIRRLVRSIRNVEREHAELADAYRLLKTEAQEQRGMAVCQRDTWKESSRAAPGRISMADFLKLTRNGSNDQ